ncbi:MAG TPA: demethoxyubiquinone hydroxylase family protein [Caulobacteraceae bacterium]|nr:demethoxyubiquinone hydroxylase family protein [Caulobacteraceae bacterium]
MSQRPLPPRPGVGAAKARLDEMLRVDHAGEVAAGAIYRGQRAVLRASPTAGRALAEIADMEAQEQEHLARFDAILIERRVRPSLLAPLWRAAGFGLGAATALIGQSAAHACTEAVETVIEGHYAAQIAEIETAEPALAAELNRFRDDELAHRDTAVAAGAHDAPAYPLLTAIVRAGCRAAIRIAEKV